MSIQQVWGEQSLHGIQYCSPSKSRKEHRHVTGANHTAINADINMFAILKNAIIAGQIIEILISTVIVC